MSTHPGDRPPRDPSADSADGPEESAEDVETDVHEAPQVPFPRVDALFAGEPLPPPAEAAPRIRRLRVVLGVALPLNLFGVFCWTGVPGAALTLYAWLLADGEVARVEAGEYASDDASQLLRIRTVAAWMLGLCVVLLMGQIWLLNTTFYNRFYDRLFFFLRDLLGA